MQNFELYIETIPKQKARKGTFKKDGIRKYLNSIEIREIINLYPDNFNYELAKQFNVSESTILTIMRKYGLKKSQFIMDFARFKTGHISFNKGKHHNHNSSTKFKKGHIPPNHKPVGSKRLTKDGYYEMKISESKKWEALHRTIWKQYYGEIPKGMIIIFRDGDHININISNLEMISRRENLSRNWNRKKFSKTMKSLWRIERLRAKYGMKRHTKLRITA